MKTEIIAHRGASSERPENTIVAFKRAMELGADAIELDVHLSHDGYLIVHHDPIPHDPPTPALANRDIQSMTHEELCAFRVRGEPIPTLEQVFEVVGTNLVVYCELKGARTAAPTVRMLTGHRTRAAIHSFDHRMVDEARRLAPDLPRGVLEAAYHVVPTDTMASVDARDLWQAAELIDKAMVDAVHAKGGRVIAWTVNDAPTMKRLASLGVDGLCSNDVALCKRTLG